MSEPAEWALAYARQAWADFRAWELYEQHPEAVAAECHRLLFLQMACEKLCKAHLIRAGAQPRGLQASHGYTAKHLPTVIRQQIIESGGDLARMQGVLTLARHLAGEIELLNPAVRRGGAGEDNCEYPWEAGDKVVSPLDWTFYPLRLVAVRGGPTFIKLLKGAIARTINELETST
jgi:hypothetical protein